MQQNVHSMSLVTLSRDKIVQIFEFHRCFLKIGLSDWPVWTRHRTVLCDWEQWWNLPQQDDIPLIDINSILSCFYDTHHMILDCTITNWWLLSVLSTIISDKSQLQDFLPYIFEAFWIITWHFASVRNYLEQLNFGIRFFYPDVCTRASGSAGVFYVP